MAMDVLFRRLQADTSTLLATLEEVAQHYGTAKRTREGVAGRLAETTCNQAYQARREVEATLGDLLREMRAADNAAA